MEKVGLEWAHKNARMDWVRCQPSILSLQLADRRGVGRHFANLNLGREFFPPVNEATGKEKGVKARRDEEQSDRGIQTNAFVTFQHVSPRPKIDPVERSADKSLGWVAAQCIGVGLG